MGDERISFDKIQGFMIKFNWHVGELLCHFVIYWHESPQSVVCYLYWGLPKKTCMLGSSCLKHVLTFPSPILSFHSTKGKLLDNTLFASDMTACIVNWCSHENSTVETLIVHYWKFLTIIKVVTRIKIKASIDGSFPLLDTTLASNWFRYR